MVKWYWKCYGCGYITIYFNNGVIETVTEKYIKDNNIDLSKAVKLHETYNCENCWPIKKIIEHMMKAK